MNEWMAGSGAHRTAERYDPRSGRWMALPRMRQSRAYCAGAFGLAGVFYVTGGITGADQGQASEIHSVEAFDTRAGRWELLCSSPSLNQPRADHGCVWADFPAAAVI